MPRSTASIPRAKPNDRDEKPQRSLVIVTVTDDPKASRRLTQDGAELAFRGFLAALVAACLILAAFVWSQLLW